MQKKLLLKYRQGRRIRREGVRRSLERGGTAGSPRFRAVLFDIDGTLLSLEPIMRSLQEACLRIGVPVLTKKEISSKILGYLVVPAFQKLRPKQAQLAKRFQKAYYEEYNKLLWTHPLPGARRTLLALRRLGVKTAAVSTKGRPIAEPGMRKAKLVCDVIITGDDVRHIKPHPEPFLKALLAMRVRPCEALAVGDHTFDILSGRRAGCTTIGVTTGACSRRELLKAGADFIISRLDGVLRIVME